MPESILTKEQQTFLDRLYEASRLCEVCQCASLGCHGGVHGGPNGPIYPRCTESGYESVIDLAALEDLML